MLQQNDKMQVSIKINKKKLEYKLEVPKKKNESSSLQTRKSMQNKYKQANDLIVLIFKALASQIHKGVVTTVVESTMQPCVPYSAQNSSLLEQFRTPAIINHKAITPYSQFFAILGKTLLLLGPLSNLLSEKLSAHTFLG